ncbi:MAG: lytic transglycosylase domain-containing protein [Gemmatimonadota bacterium]
MHASRRRKTPPWERSCAYPRHPTGRVRRRWPRAYDGELPADVAVNRRYRRVYDGDAQADRRRSGNPGRRTLETLRQSPIRNGLIGLAVAGAAAPIAVNRHQQALRTDPAHESIMAHGVTGAAADDAGLSRTWGELENAEASATSLREGAIEQNLQEYAEFGLSRELAEDIYDIAEENAIDPEVAFGLVRAESSFKNASTSPVGAVGLTQLMPKTAAWLEPGVTRSELRDPETNLRIGFKYLRQMMDKYGGDENLALLAYNRGPGTVDREIRSGRNPDNGYAAFVRGQEGHGHSLYTSR